MRWSSFYLLLFSSYQHIYASNSDNSEDKSSTNDFEKEGGFMFFMPNEVLSGRNVNACISLHNVKLPTEVTVDVQILGENHVTNKSLESDYLCFEVNMPSVDIHRKEQLYIDVSVAVLGIKTKQINEIPIVFYAKRDTALIHTDKQKYKPGDTIHIRLFVLNDELLPGYRQKAQLITIRNSLGKLEAVWQELSLHLGYLHIEYKLPERALEGEWVIEADGTKSVVDITTKSAPRFWVYVNNTDDIDKYAGAYHYQVCGKYPTGKPVKGIAEIKLTMEPSRLQVERTKETSETGCANFTIPAKDFNITKIMSDKDHYYDIDIKLVATIKESGTHLNVSTRTEMRVTSDPFNVRIDFPNFFRTGLPTPGELELINILHKYSEESIIVCYNMRTDRNIYEEIEPCRNYTFDENNKVLFTIPPLQPEVREIMVTMQSENHTRASYGVTAYRSYSPSETYLYIKQSNTDDLKCGAAQHFEVFYNVNELSEQSTFYYMVKSGQKIVAFNKVLPKPSNKQIIDEFLLNMVNGKHKFTKFGAHLRKFDIAFELDSNVLWKYEILVYTVLSNGEVVADSKQIELEPCLQNKLKVSWDKSSYHPGETAKLLLHTSPGSICSFIQTNALHTFSVDVLDVKSLLSKKKGIESYQELYSAKDNCIKPVSDWNRNRGTFYEDNDKDTNGILKDFGGVVLSSLKTIIKPCRVDRHRSRRAVSSTVTSALETSRQASFTNIDSFESWSWDLNQINATTEIHETIPKGIAKWSKKVVCISPIDGIGLSESENVTVFKPFFIDTITPYSLKQGKSAQVHVKIFNYLNDSISVTLQVSSDEKISVLSEQVKTITVNADSILDQSFDVLANAEGRAVVTVTAEVVSFKEREVVHKEILIKPKGYKLEELKTTVLCSDGFLPNTAKWNVALPKDAVINNNNRSEIILDASSVGYSIEKVGQLLTQEVDDLLVILLRNWYIVRYLDAISPKNLSLESAKYLQQGYEKILKFRNNDGSFHKFYSSPASANASAFLTTLAVKNLVRSKQYISVDENVITTSAEWIYEKQLENGCFDADAQDAVNFMPWFNAKETSLTQNSDAVLTSYILSSLLEVDIKIPETVLDKVIQCIVGYIHNSSDQYLAAISSYALLLSNAQNDEVLQILDNLIKQYPINIELEENATVRETEVISYILLSLHDKNDTVYSEYVAQAIQWLRERIGFKSDFQLTKETATPLDALAKYGVVAGFDNGIEIQLSASTLKEKIHFGSDDGLKIKRVPLKQTFAPLELKLSGKGCAQAKAVMEYTTLNLVNGPPYKLKVDTALDSFGHYCARTIKPCLALGGTYVYSYKTVMEISLPSGFGAMANSLFHLHEKKVSNIQEINSGDISKVILYFENLSPLEICTPFTIVVENGTQYTGSVKVYDYYNPDELVASEVFQVAVCNSTATKT